MIQIIYFRHNKHFPTVSISPQKINYFELTFVLEGEIEYILDGTSYLAKKGSLIFARPQMVRERKAIANMDYVSFNFTSTAELYDIPIIQKDVTTDTIKLLLRSFEHIHSQTLNFDDERLSLLLQCIFLQLKHQNKQKNEHPLVAEIKKFIKGRLKEKITLAEISKITFFSPSHCELVFKRETGKGIIDYIIEERIALAKSLLWDGTSRPSEIAEQVGFSDYNYFARAFKKRTGYTPTQYMKLAIF